MRLDELRWSWIGAGWVRTREEERVGFCKHVDAPIQSCVQLPEGKIVECSYSNKMSSLELFWIYIQANLDGQREINCDKQTTQHKQPLHLSQVTNLLLLLLPFPGKHQHPLRDIAHDCCLWDTGACRPSLSGLRWSFTSIVLVLLSATIHFIISRIRHSSLSIG